MSTKPYEDDPILTAYALGELEPDEARDIEVRLADDSAAREYVDQVRATAQRLTAALRAEPVPSIHRQEAPVAADGGRTRSWRWHQALAMAASLAVVGMLGASFFLPELNRARESADRMLAFAEDAESGTPARSMSNAAPMGPAEPARADRQAKGGERTGEWDEMFDQRQAGGQQQQGQAALTQTPATGDASGGGAGGFGGGGGGGGFGGGKLGNERREREAAETRGGGQSAPAKAGEAAPAQVEPAGAEALPAEAGEAPAAVLPGVQEEMQRLLIRQQRAQEKNGPTLATTATPQRPAAAAGDVDALLDAAVNGAGRTPDDRAKLLQDAEAKDQTLAGIAGRFRDDFNTAQYDRIIDNEFKRVGEHPLSTFSVDVDTASYSNIRRFLNGNQLPPPDAVRIEELINYFDYTYEPPPSESQHPFAARVAVADAPWNPQHRLVRIGIKGREIPQAERPASNLVFLLDVSGSMQPQNRLPLVKRAMSMLAQQLDERDRVAIVVYAGSSGLVLPSTTGDRRADILVALEKLEAGGSTNGGEGIQLAYQVARQHLIKGGVNRVILCTDGDFNIGVTDRGQLTRLIEEQAKSGVYLSILGFGMDNLKDATLEELSNKGEGNYGYIDTEHEARKLLVEQMQGTLQAIAKDVKIQVEFNPAEVGSYRLIGYENRILAKEDFNDDTKDAGDIGAGHEVTALYEVVPVEVQAKTNEARLAQLRDLEKKYLEIQAVAGQTPDGRPPHEAELAAVRAEIELLTKNQPAPPVDDLKYQEKPAAAPAAASGEMLTVKLRYKGPEEAKEQGTSTLIEFPLKDEPRPLAEMDEDFRHAASVAGFGMLLRDSPYKGTLTWPGLEELTRPLEELRAARLTPEGERRLEFRDLVQRAAALSRGTR